MRKKTKRLISLLLSLSLLMSQACFTTNVMADETAVSTTVSGAEAGKTYSFDFKSLTSESGTKMNGWVSDDGIFGIVSESDKAYNHASGHGIAIFDGDAIQVSVAGNAKVTFTACAYSSSTATLDVTDSNGTSLESVSGFKAATDGDAVSYEYKGDATVLTFTVANSGGQNYLHGVSVSNEAGAIGKAESFEVWLDDMAEDVNGVMTVEAGDYKYADSTLTLVPGLSGENYTPESSAFQNIIRAGKTVNSYRAGKRPTECNNFTTIPTAGSSVVFTPAATGTMTVYFYSTSFLRVTDFVDGANVGAVDSEAGAESYSYKAEAGHTYVMSTTGKTNNCAYAGFEYIVDENITVPVSAWTTEGEYDFSNVEVTLTDVALGTKAGVIKADTTSLTLAKGHTYSLTTNDGGVNATFGGAETYKVTDTTPISLKLTAVPDASLSGNIIGDAAAVSEIKFVNMISGTETVATINGSTYSVSIKPGEYNTVVTAKGYYTNDRVSVIADTDNKNDIYLESLIKDKYVLPDEVANSTSALTFNNVKANNTTSVKGGDGSSIVVPVNGAQKITVAGWYSGTWDINGENSVTADSSSSATSPVTTSYITDGTETSVTVNCTGTATTYLYWITVEDYVEFDNEINVPGDYETLSDAVSAINGMYNRPDGEAGRVTINLTADLQEQVVINAPYVTLNGNDHEINWYYGVAYKYYSVGNDGLFNESLFYDKYSKNEASGSLWGGVVIVQGDYFLAKNTTFRNTFNEYVTDMEILDGVENVGAMPVREKDTDVTVHSAKERSNALYLDADCIEIYNCNILSSQDTLGKNGQTSDRAYFKNCVIQGNTDYICGAGTMLFDNCELRWKTYKNDASNNAKVGYIVAPKANPYVFRNCTITTDSGVTDGIMGLYGRTWGTNSKAYFINTETNGTIASAGWGEMNAGDLNTAEFYDYNSTTNGTVIAGSTVGNIDRSTGSALSVEEVAEIVAPYIDSESQTAVDTLLNGWEPVYYEITADSLFNDSPKAVTVTSQNSGWSINEDSNGVYAVSTNSTDSSSAELEITISGSGILYYEMAASSEVNDTVVMTNNGNEVVEISGTDYTLANPYIGCVVLGEGQNVVTWTYTKDAENSDGKDCAWVKNLRVADIGDVNLDGKINVLDSILSLRYINDSSALTDLLAQTVADCNADSSVTDADVAYALKALF